MRRSLVAVLVLAGCHPKVAGTFNGTLHQTSSLASVGSLSNDKTDLVDVVIAEVGDGTFLVKVQDCSFTAKVTSSNEAFVDMKPNPIECPFPGWKDATISVDTAKADTASMQVQRSGTLIWNFHGRTRSPQGDGLFYSEFTGGRR